MQIPPDKNTRAEAMWRIVSQHVDFRGKRVIDLGCGTGDFLWRAYIAGATVQGIDIHDARLFDPIWVKGENLSINAYLKMDMNKSFVYEFSAGYDIAMCFSVLPYLDDIPAILRRMSKNFELCLIEAQYAPEPYNVGVVSDRGMAQLLLNNGFTDVESLGTTVVEGRFNEVSGKAIERTIWMCS